MLFDLLHARRWSWYFDEIDGYRKVQVRLGPKSTQVSVKRMRGYERVATNCNEVIVT